MADALVKKVWFITGSSQGVGRELVAALLANGELVVATARKPADLQYLTKQYSDKQLLVLPLDITNGQQAKDTIAAAIAKFGRIDVLVNNAGFGFIGAVEETTDEDIQRIMGNVLGTMNVTRAALPYLRKQGSGHIIQMSSANGRMTFPGASLYCGSKFFLEGFSDALAQELAPLGVKLTIVEPGAIRTGFVGSMSFPKPEQQIAAYKVSVGPIRDLMDLKTEWRTGDPGKVAQAIIKIVAAPNPPVRLLLGSDAVALVNQAQAARDKEQKAWLELSLSTDCSEEASAALLGSLGAAAGSNARG